jgi:hypothetical protein
MSTTATPAATAASTHAATAATGADEAVMTLLHDHVPLALLCDLTATDGPESADILALEGAPETRWWEQ